MAKAGGNSNDSGKKYGAAGTKRGRFNGNVTACNHAGCNIAKQSALDKRISLSSPRPIREKRSRARPFFTVVSSTS